MTKMGLPLIILSLCNIIHFFNKYTSWQHWFYIPISVDLTVSVVLAKHLSCITYPLLHNFHENVTLLNYIISFLEIKNHILHNFKFSKETTMVLQTVGNWYLWIKEHDKSVRWRSVMSQELWQTWDIMV